MPTEMVEKIFAHLSGRDLVVCKRVNREWKDIIERSPLLPCAFYRGCHSRGPVSGSLPDYSSLRHWLAGFSQEGVEWVRRFDQLASNDYRYLPETLFITMADLLVQARSFHCQPMTISHSGQVISARFSPDEQHLVTASNDDTAILCTYRDGQWQKTTTLLGSAKLYESRFSPDSRYVITTQLRERAVIYQPIGEHWQKKADLRHAYYLPMPSFSADANYLVTVSANDTAKIYGLVDGQWQPQDSAVDGHPVQRGRFHPLDQTLLFTLHHQTISIWRLVNRRWQDAGRLIHDDEILNQIYFSPDGQRLLTCSFRCRKPNSGTGIARGTAHIWHRTDEEWHREADLLLSVWMISAQFSRHGDHLLTISGDHSACELWHRSGNQWQRIDLWPLYSCATGRFSPDGQQLVTEHPRDNIARVWRFMDQQWRQQARLPHVTLEHSKGAHFNADGTHLLTVSTPKTATILGIVQGRWAKKATLAHADTLVCACFSPHGGHVLSTVSNHTVTIWTLRGQNRAPSEQ